VEECGSGHSLSGWKQLVCICLAIQMSGIVSASDTPEAILQTSSATGVTVNDKPAAASTALYRDDLIRTAKQSAARIKASGSTVDISPETIVQFDGEKLVLDHGSVSVNTTVGLRIRVGCLTVTPVNGENWTHYDVSDVDGNVTTAALKSDVYINERSKNVKQAKERGRSERARVREGERKSREDKCGGGYLSQPVAGRGPTLSSPWARGAGGVGIGVLTCLALCKNDDPISPQKP
jgi:hypothetical protein